MSEAKQWTRIDSDGEFTALFANATVVRATTEEPNKFVPGVGNKYADLYWILSDGRVLAMEVSTGGGCDTCGYGAGEKTYWVWA